MPTCSHHAARTARHYTKDNIDVRALGQTHRPGAACSQGSAGQQQKAQSQRLRTVEIYHRTFWTSIRSLQVASRFVCSVASLDRSQDHYLPGCDDLHHHVLAVYLLDMGGPSTCLWRRAVFEHCAVAQLQWPQDDFPSQHEEVAREWPDAREALKLRPGRAASCLRDALRGHAKARA